MLIVNADDFGLSRAINRGIIETIEKGAVNSVSLVASGNAIEEAVSYLRNKSTVQTGIHLTLIEEKPVSDPASVKSLLAGETFVPGYMAFMKRYGKNKIDFSEVRRELRAQIEKLVSLGVTITHCDSHQHIHLLPRVSSIVIDLCREFKIGRIRIVNEIPSIFALARAIPLAAMAFMSKQIKQTACQVGVWAVDRFFGFNTSMHVTERVIRKAVACSQKKNVELMCHPGYNEDGDRAYAHWRMDWDRERGTVITMLGKK